jgi:hypothetical protein
VKASERTPNQPDPKFFPSFHGKFDAFFGRIDLVAVIATVLALFLLGMPGMVLAALELAKLISYLWLDSIGRWLVIVMVLTVLWVAARWRKLCVY